MTGGGFGGAVIAVAPIDALAAAGDAVRQHYRTPAGDVPRIMLARPAAGAALLG
jgi:galactokinase